MKRIDVKSQCPINFATETFGDAWSFLILRDMAGLGKRTFGELLNCDERIGRSVLAERLLKLEQRGVIAKQPSGTDGRIMIYSLTEKGLLALPLLYEAGAWGSAVSPSPSASKGWFASLRLDRNTVLMAWRKALLAGSSFENGPDSVTRQLGLEVV
jgi:DNA-binding HxlR family transcriptional regulator